jgi:hypothetical protein
MRWPWLAKGGSSALIITTAASFKDGLTPGGSCMPSADAAERIDCTVKARLSSPVPGRPTTMP